MAEKEKVWGLQPKTESGLRIAEGQRKGGKLKVTYLPKGYLVVAATYLRGATVHQASVMVSPPVAPDTEHGPEGIRRQRMESQRL